MSKVEFPDLRGMSPAQKNSELIALRKFWLSKNTHTKTPRWIASFWSLVDRLFRWRIMLIRIQNPFLQGKTDLTAEQKKNEFLYFQEITDNPFFTFETLLDHVIRRLNKHVFSVAGQQAQGYVFTTETGKYEITIKEFCEKV